MSNRITASIIGASGYAGGETLRLLLDHPNVTVKQATSNSNMGKYVQSVHPNLRGRTTLKFCGVEQLEPCDVLFVGLPHGMAMAKMPEFMKKADKVIDLSSDFRLSNPADYPKWYGEPHSHPELLEQFVYGIPEVNREKLKTARYATGAGCNATATIMGLLPLVKSGQVEIERVVADIKAGSSEGGNKPSLASHHPERSGCVRSFSPAGHRHTAEVLMVTGWTDTSKVLMSVTTIEMVRGILATLHVFVRKPVTDKELWRIFRAQYGSEPFVRIVKDQQGIYRYPEPKILSGSNYCDVGFEADPDNGRIVVIAAIDNLMKGTAGNAIQAMNIMCGFDETAGLSFAGLHPC
ncbi:MAG: N-acetyl-gamma-glutamyl-phosphate reductase [Candidatus Sumerlaeota bacterium]|nr:N-acetyl-gamma-glutamyl-phosphate reductase [Candidatus Sumerlaeota bacterium]